MLQYIHGKNYNSSRFKVSGAEEGTVFHYKSVLWCIYHDWPHSILSLPLIWGWSNSRTSLRLYRRVCRIFSLRQILLYFIDPQHARVYSEKNLSLGYILKILLKCRKFQPQCFWKGDCSENCSLKCHPSSCHFFAGLCEKTDDISDEWLVCLCVWSPVQKR